MKSNIFCCVRFVWIYWNPNFSLGDLASDCIGLTREILPESFMINILLEIRLIEIPSLKSETIKNTSSIFSASSYFCCSSNSKMWENIYTKIRQMRIRLLGNNLWYADSWIVERELYHMSSNLVQHCTQKFYKLSKRIFYHCKL